MKIDNKNIAKLFENIVGQESINTIVP